MVNTINCPLTCDLPGDVELAEVPAPRHDWGDVLRCPNGTDEGLDAPCGRAFMVKETS